MLRRITGLILSCLISLLHPINVQAEPQIDGASLFEGHCAGCHLNGGNIIRRGQTLKMKALVRNNIASAKAIAMIAREGRGQMSGYGDVLGEGGDLAVAEWVWEQAQNAWTQG